MLSKKLALMTWQVIPGHVADTWRNSASVSTRRYIIGSRRPSLSCDQSGRWFRMQHDVSIKIFVNPEIDSHNLLSIRLFRKEYL